MERNPLNIELSMPQNLINVRLVHRAVKFFRFLRDFIRSSKTPPPSIRSW